MAPLLLVQNLDGLGCLWILLRGCHHLRVADALDTLTVIQLLLGRTWHGLGAFLHLGLNLFLVDLCPYAQVEVLDEVLGHLFLVLPLGFLLILV